MKTKKLNRDSNSRSALFRSQIAALIEKEEIITTAGKARVIKSLFEKTLSKARLATVHSRRQIQSVVGSSDLVKKIVDTIAPRYKDSKGGYTKVTVVGNRKGDNAPMVKLALTKKTVIAPAVKKEEKVTEPAKAKTAAPAPKVAAPKVAKPTATAKMGVSKAGMVRKSGER